MSLDLKPLVISAPFGNYVRPAGATATLGTFTLAARPGRWRQVARTVRYHRSLRSWTNKIGLRNPGILSLEGVDLSDKIVSVHGFTRDDWAMLATWGRVNPTQPLAWELNVSCPNVDEPTPDYEDIFDLFPRERTIVKLPPVRYHAALWAARMAEVAGIHACNTLPVPAGGLSGQALKPVSLEVVRAVRDLLPRATIIGGGGVKTYADALEYRRAGATHVAVGSALLNPLFTWRGLPRLIEDLA